MEILKAFEKVTSAIKEWTNDNKVQKVVGKGLSTNDYTNSDRDKVGAIPNDLVVLDGKLYLAQDGIVIDDSAVTLPSGGGGESGGSSSAVTLKNLLDSNILVVAAKQEANLKFSFSSSEAESGTAYVYINNELKMSVGIVSGDNSIDISAYLADGLNEVKLTCMDIYSNSKSLSYSVNVITLSIASTFDATIAYNDLINYTYSPIGDITKIIHFVLDGAEIDTQEISTSNRQQTFIIPKQSHNSHTFEVYATAEIGGKTAQSNHLYYDLICVTDGATMPIIACAYNNNKMLQYETITIPYIVYSPTSLTSDISLSINGQNVANLTVDRTQQVWVFRADESGELRLAISCGSIVKYISINAEKSSIDVEATAENLELFLSSYGRSNNESDPAIWSYGEVSCAFKNYNWISDGWLVDENGIQIHRVTGDARLSIPLKMFESDFRTTGKTIEFEFKTKDVRNYDTEVISCYSGNIGFKVTAQMALLKSEQSEISTQYKEDEHIRIAFVVEKRVNHRLILIYLNGIMCGATQYPTDDDFTQANAVDITIGSSDCTIDLYNIRVYNNDLTRYQILDNWIADTQDIGLKIDRYTRNNVYDAYGNIVISKLPADLPYLVLNAKTLPQYKGNKVTVSGSYTDLINSSNSFTFTKAQADVQGTSSAGYARKNYKIKFKNGFVQNGSEIGGYKLRNDSIPTNVFTFKADVASSEGANNVELVRLYNDVCPYKTPPQLANSSIRQGIDGFPIVVFHNDGENTKFVGRYNFNNDKGTPEVYGFADGDESWEICNNTSDRVLFKNADFSGTDWQNDFEARYPEDNVDVSNLSAFASWVVSTDRSRATNSVLPESVTYGDIVYTNDTAEYRLAKFKSEINDHAELKSALFYYLFTELYMLVDSRAKNAFPSLVGGDKICWLPYDMDTAIGTDNEGGLKFGYELEDIDYLPSGAAIFNGQNSVFWCNIRDCFGTELEDMYQQLRSESKLSYEVTENAYETHQAVYPEAIWNEDMYYKYVETLIETGASIYLPMLQGSKSEQRKWWLYNRFRYIDSKYSAGDTLKDFITVRGYAKSNISVEPYADIYASIKYGSYMVKKRALRGSTYTLVCPLDNVNDTEIYIYSASQLKSVGDLSGLKVGLADFSMATKLQNLKIGDANPSYDNGNLMSLTLGNNVLLKTIDVRNCSAFGTGEQQSLDISGCSNVEEVYLTGTAIKGVTLPNGGILRTLYLPNTITNLTIRNQPSLTNFVLTDSSNITTLRLENVGSLIDTPSVINAMADGGRIRTLGIDWDVASEEDLTILFNKLIKMRGLDENGNNINNAVVTGYIRVDKKVSNEIVNRFYEKFADIVIDDNSGTPYIINFLDRNGNSLYVTRVAEGANVVDPIAAGLIERPSDIVTDEYTYEFVGWSTLPQNVHQHYKITPIYKIKYTINYYNGDNLVYQYGAYQGDSVIDPVSTGKIETPTKTGTSDITYKFSKWDNLPINVQSSVNIYAQYDTYWAVRFWNDNVLYLTEWIIDGGTVVDPKQYFEDYTDPTRESTAQYDYHFSSWGGDFTTQITAVREFHAEYTSTIRRYNVYFYNGNELIYTVENVQYGSSTSYSGATPVKTGVSDPEDYVFKGWIPAPENITGETECYAFFKYTGYLFGKLGDSSQYGTVDNPNWDKINAYWTNIGNDVSALSNGTLATDDFNAKYQIGGRMIIPIELSDGTSTVADVEIIAHNHDNLADNSGKAALTFFCKDLPQILQRMNVSTGSVSGYKDSSMREFVNGELLDALPNELKSIIKPVLKISDDGSQNKKLITTTDSCWLASYDEVGFINGSSNLSGQGELYSDVFSDDKDSREKYIVDNTDTGGWWLRSSVYFTNSNSTMFWRVQKTGVAYTEIQTNQFYVAFGFCI